MVALSNKLKLKRQLEYEEQAFQDMSGVSHALTGVALGSLHSPGGRLGGDRGREQGSRLQGALTHGAQHASRGSREGPGCGLSERGGRPPDSGHRCPEPTPPLTQFEDVVLWPSPLYICPSHTPGGPPRPQPFTSEVEKDEDSQGLRELPFDA